MAAGCNNTAEPYAAALPAHSTSSRVGVTESSRLCPALPSSAHVHWSSLCCQVSRLNPDVVPSCVVSGLLSLMNCSSKSSPLFIRAAIFAIAQLLYPKRSEDEDTNGLLGCRRVAFNSMTRVCFGFCAIPWAIPLWNPGPCPISSPCLAGCACLCVCVCMCVCVRSIFQMALRHDQRIPSQSQGSSHGWWQSSCYTLFVSNSAHRSHICRPSCPARCFRRQDTKCSSCDDTSQPCPAPCTPAS